MQVEPEDYQDNSMHHHSEEKHGLDRLSLQAMSQQVADPLGEPAADCGPAPVRCLHRRPAVWSRVPTGGRHGRAGCWEGRALPSARAVSGACVRAGATILQVAKEKVLWQSGVFTLPSTVGLSIKHVQARPAHPGSTACSLQHARSASLAIVANSHQKTTLARLQRAPILAYREHAMLCCVKLHLQDARPLMLGACSSTPCATCPIHYLKNTSQDTP